MKKLITKNIRFITITVAAGLLNSAAVLTVPIYIYRELTVTEDFKILQGAIILSLMVFSIFLQLTLIVIRENYAVKFNILNFKSLLIKLFRMSYDETIKKEPTSIIDRIGMSTNAIYMFIVNTFGGLAGNVIILLSSFIFVFLIDARVAILMASALPLNVLGFRKINQKLTEKCLELQATTSNSYKEIFAIWRNTDFVKQFPSPHPLTLKSDLALTAMYESMARVNKFAQASSASLQFGNMLIQNISLLIIGLNVLTDHQSFATVVAVSMILPLFFSALNAIISANLEISELNSTLKFIEELDSSKELDSAGESNSNWNSSVKIETIEFDICQLPFGEMIKPVKITSRICRGDVVKITGRSGAGKSSFVRLLLKFRTCEKITVNGIDIRQIPNELIRARVKYIPQEPVVFPFSIAENIALGTDCSLNLNRLSHDEILAPVLIEKTLDTIILENGANLSSGEKQRISICRAVQGDFDVLILDEITSNLDRESAQALYDDIFAQFSDKIIFVITHDDSVYIPATKRLTIDG